MVILFILTQILNCLTFYLLGREPYLWEADFVVVSDMWLLPGWTLGINVKACIPQRRHRIYYLSTKFVRLTWGTMKCLQQELSFLSFCLRNHPGLALRNFHLFSENGIPVQSLEMSLPNSEKKQPSSPLFMLPLFSCWSGLALLLQGYKLTEWKTYSWSTDNYPVLSLFLEQSS